MRKVSNFCDYFLILSGNSKPHLKAISEEIEKDLAKENIKPLVSFSKQLDSGWIVLDYISVIVHIFYKPLREFYNLEHIWQDASRVKYKFSKKKS
ncbi:MAG: ribosome silencing factor [Candidatus Omnitrophica bacterium]|nr:ribosome silencing factor [Candidatus Omnitrophota bacterium]